MTQLYAALALTIIHSIWQSALLLLCYRLAAFGPKKLSPRNSQNLLGAYLFIQIFSSVVTFKVMLSGAPTGDHLITGFKQLRTPGALNFIICWGYLTAIIFQTTKMLLEWYRFRRQCLIEISIPSADVLSFLQATANCLGIKKPVKMYVSKSVHSVLTFGFIRPVILMPAALLSGLSVAETETLIIHELTHIRNNDFLRNIFLVAVDTLFLFNPFVRMMVNEFRFEREKSCDLKVLDHKYDVILYAQTLFKTLQFHVRPSVFGMTASNNKKQLERRIRFFANPGMRHDNAVRGVILAVLAFFVINQTNILPEVKTSSLVYRQPFMASKVKSAHLPVALSTSMAPREPVSVLLFTDELPAQASPLLIRKQRSRQNPVAASITATAEVPTDLSPLIIPIANAEKNIKEVIVIEEASGNPDVVTKTFSVEFKDGEWRKELLYLQRHGKSLRDSCAVVDSVRILPPQMQ